MMSPTCGGGPSWREVILAGIYTVHKSLDFCIAKSQKFESNSLFEFIGGILEGMLHKKEKKDVSNK